MSALTKSSPRKMSEKPASDAPVEAPITESSDKIRIQKKRPRSKKEKPRVAADSLVSGSEAKSKTESGPVEAPAPVESPVEVEAPEKKEEGLAGLLSRAASRAGLLDEEAVEAPKKKGKADKEDMREEFTSLVIALLTLFVAFSNIPGELAPNADEVRAFSHHLTGILLRHIPISGKLTEDALDMIGMIAVVSGYYMRIKPDLERIRQGKTPAPVEGGSAESGPVEVVTDGGIGEASPKTGEFLKRAEGNNGRDKS